METALHAQLARCLTVAIHHLTHDLQTCSPLLAEKFDAWIRRLAGESPRESYFMHPEAFPMLLFPIWLETSLCQEVDWAFQQDVISSSVSAYYFIRMIDNVMDVPNSQEVRLLPLLSFLHTECVRPYFRYFDYQHPFWQLRNKIWTECAEATVIDAESLAFDRTLFQATAAKKVHASKIPLAAVCLHHGCPEIPEAWQRLHDLMSCWHQMGNDTFDWQRDLACQTPTYFLSEAQRRLQPGESVLRWVAREGLAWAIDLENQWMAAMQSIARQLGNTDLLTYLAARDRDLHHKALAAREGFKSLEPLLALGEGHAVKHS